MHNKPLLAGFCPIPFTLDYSPDAQTREMVRIDEGRMESDGSEDNSEKRKSEEEN